jgi:hypothetical protein
MTRPPQLQLSPDALESEAKLHEELVSLFGAYLMWCRSDAIETISKLIESETDRQKLPTATRGVFEDAAARFEADSREIVAELNARVVGHFGREILHLLSGTGGSLPVSPDLVARFRLIFELCDRESGEVVREEIINRGGMKYFADYWNNWISRQSK